MYWIAPIILWVETVFSFFCFFFSLLPGKNLIHINVHNYNYHMYWIYRYWWMLFYLNVITRKSHDYAFHKSKASPCINLQAAEVGKKAATSPSTRVREKDRASWRHGCRLQLLHIFFFTSIFSSPPPPLSLPLLLLFLKRIPFHSLSFFFHPFQCQKNQTHNNPRWSCLISFYEQKQCTQGQKKQRQSSLYMQSHAC